MKKIKIKINSNIYNVKLAKTDEEHEQGLQGVKELPENEGMLFEFDEIKTREFWMLDTLIPLDIIFINEDLEVTSVQEGVPESKELLKEDNVAYVLELNKRSGIRVGDELEFSPDSKIKSDKMQVLDSEGNTQMELEGGERIFSRPNTKILIKFAKKSAATSSDNDYKALGKRVFKFLDKQESNDPEYVKKKD